MVEMQLIVFETISIKCSWYKDLMKQKSGQAGILLMLFWTGILKILAKTLQGRPKYIQITDINIHLTLFL